MQRIGVTAAVEGAVEYFNTLDRINKAAAGVVAAMQPLVAALNRYDDQAGDAAHATAALAASTQPAEKELHQLDTQATEAGNAVLGMGKDASAATGGVDKLGDTADRAGKESVGLGDDAEKGGKKLNFLEQAAVGAARKLGEFAVQGAAAAARAIVDFAKDGVKAAGDFEGGMNRFGSVAGEALDGTIIKFQQTDGTMKEMSASTESFKQQFISLGRDLPVSTAEVQEAAINMAKGGIEPATIAAGGLRTVLDLAAAGEVGIAEAAEIASKQLGVWVDRAADATTKAQFLGQAADLLAQAANASTVDVDELALGLANVGGIAKVSGLSFQETVQTMALLAPGFSSAADAGTSFKTFLSRLQPTTETAAGAMKDLGLLTKDGTSAFYDAEGSFIGMDKAAGILQDSLKGLSQAEKTAKLQAIFGTDAFRTAALIAEQGSKGFEDMGVAMSKAGTASEQAAKKQQGFNVATDNMMGSLEAFQIVVFSAALPALTGLVNVIAGGINVITDYAQATIEGTTALSGIASFISATALPAIIGLTAGVTAWAIVQAVQATPAVLASIPAIVAQTVAFIANATAVLAAVAPFAVIAVAIGGAVLVYQQLTEKVQSATQELLNSKPFWTDSTTVLENYGNASKATQEKLAPLAEALRTERQFVEDNIESLGKRMAAGLVSDEQYAREMEIINANAHAIEIQTGMLGEQMQAEIRATAASMTATEQAAKMRDGTEELGAQANLTADDIKTLGDKIKEAYDKGQEAVQGYATNQAEFLAGVEQRQTDHAATIAELEAKKQKAVTAEQKRGIDDQIDQANDAYHDQEQAAASSYARQQADQKKHLGQMLIDYTVAQASLGNINKDKAAAITQALEKEYGLQQSSVASTFLKMAGSIDTFAHSSNQDVSSLTKTLHDQQQQAADTQRAMDDYAKTYTSEAVSNFLDAKSDADEYIQSLESIPSEVQSAMKLPYIDDREQEIRDFKKSIDDLPPEKIITITVRVNRPDDMIPGSPTPFEIALYGIADALDAVATEASSMPDFFSRFGNSASTLLGIIQQIGDATAGMFSDLASISRQEAQNQRDIDQLGVSRAAAEQKLLAVRQEADRIAETDPEKAKAYYAQESQQVLELARLQDEMHEARKAGDEEHFQSLKKQYAAIAHAQQLEDQAREAAASGDAADPITELFARVNEAFNDLDITIEGDFPQFLTDLQHLISQLTSSGHARGGSIAAMNPYLVGERGPELIVPTRDSTVLTASETRQALSTPQMSTGGSQYSRVTNLSVTIQGNGVTFGDVVAGVQAGLRAEGRDADVRIRTGVG